MMWLKKLLLRWTQQAIQAQTGPVLSTADWAQPKSPNQLSGDTQVTVGIRKVMNGYVLEMGSFKANPRGPDWTYTHFILPEGGNIPEAVAALLVKQRLEQ